jgi:hypothetical protein
VSSLIVIRSTRKLDTGRSSNSHVEAGLKVVHCGEEWRTHSLTPHRFDAPVSDEESVTSS